MYYSVSILEKRLKKAKQHEKPRILNGQYKSLITQLEQNPSKGLQSLSCEQRNACMELTYIVAEELQLASYYSKNRLQARQLNNQSQILYSLMQEAIDMRKEERAEEYHKTSL